MLIVDEAAVLKVEKAREEIYSTSGTPQKGDAARIDYAFTYQEAHGSEELLVSGVIAADFAFDGEKYAVADKLELVDTHYGVTDVMVGTVTDCQTGLPLYKAEITILFRDGKTKRLYTGQAGEYAIRAVKGEDVTVRAAYPLYAAEEVQTFVPDQVDFTLCLDGASPGPAPDPVTAPAPAAGITDLATGLFHTCAVTLDHRVRCWGKNDEGQLGNNSLASSSLPVTVSALSDAAQVEAGMAHTCVLTTAGAVKCWGKNTWGQLGNATYNRSLTPVQVAGLSSGVRAIAVGENFSCALKHADGSVVCWGLNNAAQIGNNAYDASSGPAAPTQVLAANGTAYTGADSIEAGGNMVCVTKAGALTCWGGNDFAQLALNSATGPAHCDSPYGPVRYCAKTAAATTLTVNVTSISLAQYSGCALMNDSSVQCWGDNRARQLGTGEVLEACVVESYGTIPCSLPVRGVGLGGAVNEIMAGTANGFYCVVMSGAVTCWGGVSYANMGIGAPEVGPTVMAGATAGLSKLSAGYYHVCGITPDGKPECWGRNVEGELGVGDTASHDAPVRVRGF